MTKNPPPKPTLRLRPPKPPTLNPSSSPATITIRSQTQSQSQSTSKSKQTQQPQTIEVNLADAVQPFLDPDGWERVRGFGGETGASEKEREEEGRRKRVREGEFGGMAVRGRMGRFS